MNPEYGIRLCATALVVALFGAPAPARRFPVVHRHVGGDSDVLANAYLVETPNGVVVVDATMTVAESGRLRADLLDLHKPLLAILITHGHPDHYGGVTGVVGSHKVPVIAVRAVDRIIRRDDAVKGEALKRAGIVWAEERTFPARILDSGQSVTFDDVRFTVYDAGPGESEADSFWVMNTSAANAAFVGDMAINRVHGFLSDGHSIPWLDKLDSLKSTLQGMRIATIYPGHGEPGGLELLDWTKAYLKAFHGTVRELSGGRESLTAEQKAELARRMAIFLPENRLPQFVLRSADPVATELARKPASR